MPKYPNGGGSEGPNGLIITTLESEALYVGQILHVRVEFEDNSLDISNITILGENGQPLTLASGDVNHNDIRDAGEAWVYNTTHTVTAAELAAGTPLTLFYQGQSAPPGADPLVLSADLKLDVSGPLRAVNLVSGDGGAHWYFQVGSDPHDNAADISILTGIAPDHLLAGTPHFSAGQALKFFFAVKNVSPDAVTNVHVTDVAYSVDFTLAGLAAGATSTTVVSASAIATALLPNTLAASTTVNGLVLQDSHEGSYFTTAGSPFLAGPAARELSYWKAHPEAWAQYVVEEKGVRGVWVGDLDRRPDDPMQPTFAEHSLFVPVDAVKQLFELNGSDDLREAIAAQAIVAQFNYNAGVHLAGSEATDSFQGDVLSDAVAFLYGGTFGARSFYGDFRGADITAGDEFLSAGPSNSFDFNTKTHKLTSTKTTPGSVDAKGPHTFQSEDYGDFQVSGQGLLSALRLFNGNHLVADGQGHVAWNATGEVLGPYTNVMLNGPNDFWSVLHSVSTGKGLFEGIF